MRIGINASFFAKPSTGIGVVTLEFMRALSIDPEQGKHEWYWYHEGPLPQGEWPKNWQFREVSSWWSRDDLLHRYLIDRFALPRAVRRDHCEVFFSLYQSATVLPSSIRHTMLVHDLIPKRFPAYLVNHRQRFFYTSVERGIKEATTLIAPSRATAEDILAFLKTPRESIHVIPLGIAERYRRKLAPPELLATLERYDIRPGYIYHGGGLEKRKNTEAVLRAYRALQSSVGRENTPPLVISGTVHSERNPLATPVRSLIQTLQLEKDVKLLGWVPDTDLPALYQGALFFVFPSLAEGFGLPVVEALASGTPVITSDRGALSEVTRDTALLIDPDNDESLRKAMERLSIESTLRETLSSRGLSRSEEFRFESFAVRVRSLLIQ